MSNLPVPRYSLWQAVSAALAVALRAIEEVRALSREPGPQGERGERGERGPDALGFNDLSVTYDGERRIVLRFARGDQVEEFSVDLPIVLDRGVWKEGEYKKGDGVTLGGSFFIAQCDTKEKPEMSSDWRLAIKRGRDGASAYDVARKAGFKGNEKEWIASLKGEPGRDLTQIGPDGRKW